ncbi:uncharacterized protein LOC127161667 [Labeo rohita]|uniref:uncharacterized protein LOC127161667 n=1 Tax=Labeo rohita TaxID=84645 RepID=UPI0021E20F5C|nr:uncharacterized protein LOC127161667 [Labeo rohita]
MIISCFICVFAVLVNKVCPQVTVEAVIGGSVVLPCSSTQHDLKLQDIDVYWVYSGSTNVIDIIKGEESEAGQDTRYKNRTKTFQSDAYLRGNFSIKLTAVTHADAGKYTCLITHSSEHETVELIIKESTTEKGNKTTDQENPNQTETVPNETLPFQWVSIVVSVLVLLILFIFAFFIILYLRTKRAQAPVFTSTINQDQTTVT